MTMRQTILERMTEIAAQQGRPLVALNDEVSLLDSGLDSLCIAILVATLDDELGLDPLSAADNENFPVTVGDFIRVYENAA